jgi:shikimate dehydrogenase
MKKSFALGLIGWPLEHSLSPALHQAALRSLGLDGGYHLYPVPSFPEGEQDISKLLAEMRGGKIQGLNVTIPHKENIIPLLDLLTPAAQAIGAVNTIVIQSGKLLGDNTDAGGFWTDLCASLPVQAFERSKALILGAGGSARAVAYALLSHGWSVTLAARSAPQAANICEQLSIPDRLIEAVSLQQLRFSNLQSSPTLIVNCTPVGMFPDSNFSPWPKNTPFPLDASIYDLVYNPRETLFVRQARGAGLAAVNGLGMLIEQAALAFERWTNVEAPRDLMRAALAE